MLTPRVVISFDSRFQMNPMGSLDPSVCAPQAHLPLDDTLVRIWLGPPYITTVLVAGWASCAAATKPFMLSKERQIGK